MPAKLHLEEPEDFDRPSGAFRFRPGHQGGLTGHRLSPWHAFVPDPDESPSWKTRWRDRWHQHAIYHQWQRLTDALVGWQDAWARRGRQRPSYAAQEEWWAYYQGLYQEHDPDLFMFDRLLRRRGVPDWVNPYPMDDEAHYDFHPDGLMLADIQAVLLGVRARWSVERGDPTEIALLKHHGEMAAACMGLALARGKARWPITRAHVGAENLAMVVTEAALADLTAYRVSPVQVLQGAVRAQLLDAADADLIRPVLLQVGAVRSPPGESGAH